MPGLKFRGKYDHSIDEKGRLSFPSRYREVLRQYDTGILIVIPWDDHLRLYPLAEWESLENKLKAEDSDQLENLDKILRYFESESYECTLDKQGRVLIPPALRADLGLKKDIVLIGMIERVEIWDKDTWEMESKIGRAHFQEHKATIKKRGII